ncbi:transposase [Mycolicibacterium thermoresistibile]|uniref:Transposase IS3/IS911 family protein n=2 Tax=Mycolicibacterium thermoresistibile TaxID=1797 RepID=G7CEF2_MYCT3|nr:transposase [Mycolicibacterium thermoresistibile]EHI13645.1 transposase IS3/IS911 family protein [Mycolicibacterium thermoresistibile ATCC 19527]MCV7188120.1 transposase [Mycolicibacterium thermoresistibile]GAT16125.1 transposase IS3/IS911 family protein [Mycolicibacterium thermoresistibile]SNW16308.1 transposase IS3/IS911 family protein [Mycolicibacterium thermoresistibile]
MSRTRRSFTSEFKVEAARRVIDGGRSVVEVARELNVHENLLRKWVAGERIRDGAAADARRVPPDGDLTATERAELVRLRAEVAEKDRDITFLKKVSAYFAAQQHR